MQELISFNSPEFGMVRTVEVDGEPWFVGKDVAEALGYSDTAKAIRVHVDLEDRGVDEMATPGGKQDLTIINESGLYSLVLSSKLPDAKRFKRWITSEVLPSIRKHGAYMTAETLQAAFLNPDTLEQIAGALRQEQAQKLALAQENERQRQALAALEPYKQYVDTILESTSTVTTTQIAADYNLSARKLNQILRDERIQRYVNGQWILYKKHMEQGYVKSKTFKFTHADGREDVKQQTQWTQKGRLMIHELLTKRGIQPIMDQGVA